MTTINFLSTADNIYPGDLFPIWSTFSSDTRKISVSQIGNYFSQNYTFRDSKVNIYVAPQNNDTVNLYTNGGGVWVVIDGLTDIDNLTITFPSILNLNTGEEIIINLGPIGIQNANIESNGANILYAPTFFSAYAYLKYKYNKISNTWYTQGGPL